ncbi:MAG TPA: hypothetical protein PKU70_02730 [Vicinamibacteria bacterium]|nr:hypothetical protein [Vicinamibacteria bacterium]HRB11899.1 hypothetical protein [Vicinamibacteria bacterium]
MATKKKAVRKPVARGSARTARTAPRTASFERPEEVERWIRREVAAQERIYRGIVREMNALNDRRIKWVKEFYQRLQTRGFSVHAGIRRKVRPEEIPPVPKRIRVVF